VTFNCRTSYNVYGFSATKCVELVSALVKRGKAPDVWIGNPDSCRRVGWVWGARLLASPMVLVRVELSLRQAPRARMRRWTSYTVDLDLYRSLVRGVYLL